MVGAPRAGVGSEDSTSAAGQPDRASEETAAPGSRRSASTHDPLSGPWPSFTKKAEEAATAVPAAASARADGDEFSSPATESARDAEPASPLGAAPAPAFAAPQWRVTVDAAAAPPGHDTSDEDQSSGGERGDAAPAGDAFVPPRSLPALAPGSANVGAAAGARYLAAAAVLQGQQGPRARTFRQGVVGSARSSASQRRSSALSSPAASISTCKSQVPPGPRASTRPRRIARCRRDPSMWCRSPLPAAPPPLTAGPTSGWNSPRH